MIDIQIIRPETHDPKEIADAMQTEDWESLEDHYNSDGVAKFISESKHFFLLAYVDEKVVGMLTAYILERMDQKIRNMYVDEVETKPNFRKQGVAKAMMEKIIEIAKAEDCSELWVGTELDNEPANNLYNGIPLKKEVLGANVYTYVLD